MNPQVLDVGSDTEPGVVVGPLAPGLMNVTRW